MEKFTIYCSQEQTVAAFRLGAPITYKIPVECEEELSNGGLVFPTDAELFNIPTAEQMIGWINEYDSELKIKIIEDKYAKWTYSVYKSSEFSKYESYFQSRKEAILAAIDVALKYLRIKANDKN